MRQTAQAAVDADGEVVAVVLEVVVIPVLFLQMRHVQRVVELAEVEKVGHAEIKTCTNDATYDILNPQVADEVVVI